MLNALRDSLEDVSHVHPFVIYAKRIFDILSAFVGLCLTAVLLPFIVLAIKLDSKGPLFFHQLRVGRLHPDRTELFLVHKFRTMYVGAESDGKAQWAKKDDPRITRVGKWLRLIRMDELPQLYNVLCGEMSLIGPRPERPVFIKQLEESIPFYTERSYGVAPGITGYAQIKLGYDEKIEDVKEKVQYDHAYALALSKPMSWISMDIFIFLQTIKVVILGRGQ